MTPIIGIIALLAKCVDIWVYKLNTAKHSIWNYITFWLNLGDLFSKCWENLYYVFFLSPVHNQHNMLKRRHRKDWDAVCVYVCYWGLYLCIHVCTISTWVSLCVSSQVCMVLGSSPGCQTGSECFLNRCKNVTCILFFVFSYLSLLCLLLFCKSGSPSWHVQVLCVALAIMP